MRDTRYGLPGTVVTAGRLWCQGMRVRDATAEVQEQCARCRRGFIDPTSNHE